MNAFYEFNCNLLVSSHHFSPPARISSSRIENEVVGKAVTSESGRIRISRLALTGLTSARLTPTNSLYFPFSGRTEASAFLLVWIVIFRERLPSFRTLGNFHQNRVPRTHRGFQAANGAETPQPQKETNTNTKKKRCIKESGPTKGRERIQEALSPRRRGEFPPWKDSAERRVCL